MRIATAPAAKRRKSTAHGASRGFVRRKTNQPRRGEREPCMRMIKPNTSNFLRTRAVLFAAALLTLCTFALSAAPQEKDQDWTNYVRIGAYGLKGGDAKEIVRKAQESGVFGIEVDNDIPGR